MASTGIAQHGEWPARGMARSGQKGGGGGVWSAGGLVSRWDSLVGGAGQQGGGGGGWPAGGTGQQRGLTSSGVWPAGGDQQGGGGGGEQQGAAQQGAG